MADKFFIRNTIEHRFQSKQEPITDKDLEAVKILVDWLLWIPGAICREVFSVDHENFWHLESYAVQTWDILSFVFLDYAGSFLSST